MVSGKAGRIKIVPPAAEHLNSYLLSFISYLHSQLSTLPLKRILNICNRIVIASPSPLRL